MPLNTLSTEILLKITSHLNYKDFYRLTNCNKSLYQLNWIDSIYKDYSNRVFGLYYNHPEQSYRQLFVDCCNATRHGNQKQQRQLPCNHIHFTMTTINRIIVPPYIQCQQCSIQEPDQLFMCIANECRHIFCDRHARQHTRYKTTQMHSVFYKLNTSEFYCQTCIDWIGDIEANIAEQYIVSQWIAVNSNTTKRQFERRLRWQDTPQYVMSNDDYCFIPANWMKEWELYVEGWRTNPPFDILIDQTKLVLSTGNINIISNTTWKYLLANYRIKGNKVTKFNLKPACCQILNRIQYWKNRVN